MWRGAMIIHLSEVASLDEIVRSIPSISSQPSPALLSMDRLTQSPNPDVQLPIKTEFVGWFEQWRSRNLLIAEKLPHASTHERDAAASTGPRATTAPAASGGDNSGSSEDPMP